MRLLGSGALHIMSKKGPKCLTGKLFPSPFPLLQVTQSSSWPWLRGVRWEEFACSSGFRPGSLEQLTCACTDTGLNITPGTDTEQSQEELGLALWCSQQRLLGWFSPLSVAQEGKGTPAATQRGQEAWNGQHRHARRPHCPS